MGGAAGGEVKVEVEAGRGGEWKGRVKGRGWEGKWKQERKQEGGREGGSIKVEVMVKLT